MKPIKAILSSLPGVKRLYETRARRRRARFLNRLGGTVERFTHFYHTNKWKNAESRSGPGSTIEYTRNIRAELPGLFERLGVVCILDAPCGEYHWFRLVPREGIHYIGGDIVKEMVVSNQGRYGDDHTEFRHLDIVYDDLPAADLWMCRDCLFHFSDEDAVRSIRSFLGSDIRYLLTSTHPECDENVDIPTGSFRLLNLEREPYCFGAPMVRLDDWIEGFPVRHLALWEKQTLAGRLRSNPAFA